MPVVPRYEQQQVQQRPLPQVQVPTSAPEAAFGGGASTQNKFAAASGVAKQIQDVALVEKKKADDSAFLDLDLQASQLQTQLETKAKTMQGKDAGAAPDFVNEEWQKGSDEILKGASNDHQRQSISQALKVRYMNLDKTVNIHVAGEIEKYQDQSADAYIKNARDEGINNFDQPDRVDLSIFQQHQAIESYAERKGISPENKQEMLQESASKTHSGVINRMLALGNDVQAKAWYDEHKDQIMGADKKVLDASLKEGSLRGESLRKSDEIISNSDNMTEALAATKDIKDPQLHDATKTRIRQSFQEREEARRTDQNQTFEQFTLKAEQAKSLDVVPPEVLNSLTTDQRRAMEVRVSQVRAGIQPATDWNKYYELKTMASSPELRPKFLQESMMVHRNELADGEFKELVNLQSELRNKSPEAEKKLDGFRTNTDIVNSTLLAAGFDPTPKPGTTMATKVNNFKARVDKDVTEVQRRTGKEATNEQITDITNKLMIKVKRDNGFLGSLANTFIPWDTSTRAFEIGISEVPKADRALIEDALRRANRPVSDGAIVNIYLKQATSAK